MFSVFLCFVNGVKQFCSCAVKFFLWDFCAVNYFCDLVPSKKYFFHIFFQLSLTDCLYCLMSWENFNPAYLFSSSFVVAHNTIITWGHFPECCCCRCCCSGSNEFDAVSLCQQRCCHRRLLRRLDIFFEYKVERKNSIFLNECCSWKILALGGKWYDNMSVTKICSCNFIHRHPCCIYCTPKKKRYK